MLMKVRPAFAPIGLLRSVLRADSAFTTKLEVDSTLVSTLICPGKFYEAAQLDACETPLASPLLMSHQQNSLPPSISSLTGWMGDTDNYLCTIIANLSEWMTFRRVYGRGTAILSVRRALHVPKLTLCTAGPGTGTSTLLASVAHDLNANKDSKYLVVRFNALKHQGMGIVFAHKLIEEAERQRRWPALIIDAAEECKALFEDNLNLGIQLSRLTRYSKRMSVVLASSDFARFSGSMKPHHREKFELLFEDVLHLGECAACVVIFFFISVFF